MAVFLLLPAPQAEASYGDPFWTSNSPSPECACGGCDCPRPPEWSPEGVSYRTLEARHGVFLFDTPGMRDRHNFSLRAQSLKGTNHTAVLEDR